MKFFYVLGVVFLWQDVQGNVIRYPQHFKVKINNPERGKHELELTWEPVQNWDEQDPIIGYKVAVWEMKVPKTLVQTEVNGEIQTKEADDYLSPATVPVGDPKIYTVIPNERQVVHKNMKPDVWYEYAALAFTKKGEGPLSTPASVKTLSPENSTEKNVNLRYLMDIK